MFDFICGEVISSQDNSVVLKCNDIGYILGVSISTMRKCIVGSHIQLFTYLAVREDAINLYGFSNIDERNMFLRLLTVSGIGAKTAMGILSSISINELAISILRQDVKSLSLVKGIGKKTAERIILELKEKISPLDLALNQQANIGGNQEITSEAEQALTILLSLGLNKTEALRRIRKATDNGITTTEDILNASLKG